MLDLSYAELHCRSNFSFLEGGSHPEELVQKAHALGYEAIAITDRATLAGIVRAHGAVKQIADASQAGNAGRAAIRLIVGAHLEPVDAMPLVVWATNRTGYSHLCRLLTRGYAAAAGSAGDVSQDGRANACVLSLADIAAHAEGLLAGVPLAAIADAGMSDAHGQAEVVAAVAQWREVFGDRLVALAEVALEGDDEERLWWYATVGRQARVPLVAAGDVRYHERSRLPLFDALTAVRHGCTVEEVRGRLLSNGERHLHDRRNVAERFATLAGAVERSVEIARRCTFSLAELQYEYPDATVPAGRTPAEHLADLTWRGAAKRYPAGPSSGIPAGIPADIPAGIPERVRSLIDHELALVAELGYEAYFLTVFDIVRFARRRGILCQGRGSAANSAICYCLGITSVDPARMDVLFERFISRERCEAPDIDIDFEHDRREEVIQYVYETYGRRRAALTAEVISYRLRSAVRDIAKVLGFSLDRVEEIASVLDAGDGLEALPQRLAEAGLDPEDDTCTRLTTLVGQLVGFPRHLGQHVGGMVMTRGDLCDLVPIQPAAMDGRTVIQWDKNDLDELGILKVDCLALGMLTAIHRAFDLVEAAGGPKLTLATVPAEDPAVYEMISRADTVGVFQIESRAQMSMLPRLKPACFYDLVIEVAIVRPGPIQGDMVHPYLRRRSGEEPVTFPNEAIRAVLEKTLGVPLFQEQAMRLAVVAAGFTPGEADQLRRAMGAWRRPGVIDEFHRKLVDGMRARGLSQRFAEQVFQQIRGFGEYGFPESHAASFALLVYVSAWLKRHHPAAFTAALLGSQPMGFYAPAQLVRDAKEHGVRVLPVDVNASAWQATVEVKNDRRRADNGRWCDEREASSRWPGTTSGARQGPAVRLGLEQVYGLGEVAGRRIETARQSGPFRLPHELARRAHLDRESLLHLARAGAFESLGLDRRRAVWEAMRCLDRPESQPLLRGLQDEDDSDESDDLLLPAMTRQEDVIADYRTAGLSLRAHPLHFERTTLADRGVVTASEAVTAPEGRRVQVAGIVLTRQRPGTAGGTIFLTIEDETDSANIVVQPAVWQAADHAARRAAVLIVHGRIQRRGPVVHILATSLEPLTLATLPRMSRDFC